MSRRPIMIPILRTAGIGALVTAAGLCTYAVVLHQRVPAPVAFVLAAVALGGLAAATGRFLLGFATNLAILEDIRRLLRDAEDG